MGSGWAQASWAAHLEEQRGVHTSGVLRGLRRCRLWTGQEITVLLWASCRGELQVRCLVVLRLVRHWAAHRSRKGCLLSGYYRPALRVILRALAHLILKPGIGMSTLSLHDATAWPRRTREKDPPKVPQLLSGRAGT